MIRHHIGGGGGGSFQGHQGYSSTQVCCPCDVDHFFVSFEGWMEEVTFVLGATAHLSAMTAFDAVTPWENGSLCAS